MTTDSTGRLWVVATPIGNLDDLSVRAREVLGRVALIAAEDTRHSAPLLARYGIGTRVVALHEHNERDEAERLVARLRGGDDIALISDAGTPLVSDPGFRLVRAARAAGIVVSPVPGACAAIAALSVAGLPSDRFVFEGFLPAKAAARRERLGELAGEARTLVFYESSHRVRECLDDMAAVFGAARPAVLARELTKLFETVIDADLATLVARVAADPNQSRGEFVLLVGGRPEQEDARLAEGRRVFALLRAELPPARAAKLAAAISGAPRKALYGSDEG
ncbi:MAG: 16S rRNA (cytidine(1402)-2'-O)-methyltransferase [Lysobacterales bacterium 69-70]|nr:16S rRNA (cytidine(1402)-2'-O)-methyltransferase [Xanthomonadaceae bacterium]ODU36446.1 MAG: 16S rRNA (cytidine(1402)-2'-O)-methyltransferase [Xanthomonadaceae bacterium SCN 69-320]ODV21792.1 MAG: 16S rRNA (cytidine(1402)-2'-O)-methyltransferase [Xanthomonadaceae bacterium SCN 69-25]OJY95992.1 MAG: 16S rRNA (cytidine(1402)-2'-O)-methyltransferase [Xanthomonadales bacterium 69-70]